MTTDRPSIDLSSVAVIIPALDEAESLEHLLPILVAMNLGQILVCDNGSTDSTQEVALRHGVTWVYEPRRGYGAACYAGVEALHDSMGIVVFVDADMGSEVGLLTQLVEPIVSDQADFVLGARLRKLREEKSTTLPQRLGNWLLPLVIQCGWGYRYYDLGPFRAIRREALETIGMRDRAYGWTIEMQIRAVELGLRIQEIPIPQRKRKFGRSKISGHVRGVALASYWIIRTSLGLYLTKRKRLRACKPVRVD